MLSKIPSALKYNQKIITITFVIFLIAQLFEVLVVNWYGFNFYQLCSWDCSWYSGIVESGYDLKPHAHEKGDAANWAFFPLFPYISKPLYLLSGISSGKALVIASKLFTLLSIFSFIKFCQVYEDTINPAISACVVAFSPYALYGNVGYTESCFLFLTCIFFIQLKSGNYLKAGMAGAALTATRFVGLSAAIAYLCFILINKAQWRASDKESITFSLLLIPLGISLYSTYLYFLTGDALAFSHIQRAWNRYPENPITVILNGFKSKDTLHIYWAFLSLTAIASTIYFFYKRYSELALFSLICTLVPLSTGLWAMPRYIWWQAPLLLLVVKVLSTRKSWIIFLPLFLLGSLYMYYGWFTGKDFVV